MLRRRAATPLAALDFGLEAGELTATAELPICFIIADDSNFSRAGKRAAAMAVIIIAISRRAGCQPVSSGAA